MKVLYIAHSAEMQGAGFALLNILQGMVERNINVYVVVPREGRLTVILKDMGIPFLIIPFLMQYILALITLFVLFYCLFLGYFGLCYTIN